MITDEQEKEFMDGYWEMLESWVEHMLEKRDIQVDLMKKQIKPLDFNMTEFAEQSAIFHTKRWAEGQEEVYNSMKEVRDMLGSDDKIKE